MKLVSVAIAAIGATAWAGIAFSTASAAVPNIETAHIASSYTITPQEPVDCTTLGNGSPGNSSFTFHLTQDRCVYNVRGYADCETNKGYIYGPGTTGPAINTVGQTSKADCGTGGIAHYGWFTYLPSGTVVKHQIG